MNAVIEELKWDSELFGKKIGVVTVSEESLSTLPGVLSGARAEGFAYLICKLREQRIPLLKALESSGFYLSDIGVTLSQGPVNPAPRRSPESRGNGEPVMSASPGDIPLLREMVTSLFRESRFYGDPFYSEEDADRLFRAWIENSVRKKVADLVLVAPRKGFITCRMRGANAGEIVLFGVAEPFRGKGIGTRLLEAALAWFGDRGANSVSVRTQLKNIPAINFYLASGFSLLHYDIVLANIL